MTLDSTTLALAREWVDDCEWADNPETSAMSMTEIIHGIDRHYAGGWEAFKTDATDSGMEQ